MNRRILWVWMAGMITLGGCQKIPTLTRGDLSFPPLWDNTLPARVSQVRTYSFYLGQNPDPDRFQDLDTLQTDIQDRVLVTFTGPMDEATLAGAITLEGAAGTQIGPVPVDVQYDPEAWRVWIIPQVGLRESTAYVLRIASTARDQAGNPLDGNGNGKADDTLDTFYAILWGPPGPGGGDPVFDLDLSGPRVRDFWTDSRNPWFYPGNLLTEDTLRLEFSRLDLDGGSLAGNVFFRTYPEGTPAGNLAFIRLDTAGTRVQAVFFYSGLIPARAYALVLTPDIQDTAGNPLDGNGNGERELQDSLIILFTTADSLGNPPAYPHYMGGHRQGNVVTLYFDQPMDTTAFVSPDLQVQGMVNGQWIQEPIRLQWAPDLQSVDVLLPLSDATLHQIFLSHRLRSRDGLPFDGNWDGLGGDPRGDDLILLF